MAVDRELRTTFDQVARLYDEARPGYPEEMIDDLVSFSEIPPAGRILEIGCGTGQATLPFARRGYAMLCLELGEHLAALAAAHCQPYPNVQIQHLAFEDWPVQRERFDLVMSASAFDWILPEIAYPKAAASLKASGSIALFWHDHIGADTPFFRATRRLRERVPELADAVSTKPPEARLAAIEQQILSSGLFGPPVTKRYPWSTTYTAKRYINLLRTYSAVRALPPNARREFLVGIQSLIAQHGGVVQTRYLSFLVVSRVVR